MFTKQVSARRQRGSPKVAAEAQQVEQGRGKTWSRARSEVSVPYRLLMAFFVVTLLVAWAAWLVWNESKLGGVLTLGLLPVEASFWIGFDLPIPKVIGVARVVFLTLGWTSLH
jgi:hypothetical protein